MRAIFPSVRTKIVSCGLSFPPCDEISICAGTLSFRASQLPFCAGKNPSVRPFFDLCRQNHRFLTILANGDGQKETVALLRRMREGCEWRARAHRRDFIWHFGRTACSFAATSRRRRFNYETTKCARIIVHYLTAKYSYNCRRRCEPDCLPDLR